MIINVDIGLISAESTRYPNANDLKTNQSGYSA
jgi:hypothetical protein